MKQNKGGLEDTSTIEDSKVSLEGAKLNIFLGPAAVLLCLE